MNRRKLITHCTALFGTLSPLASLAQGIDKLSAANKQTTIKAIAFDAFPIFDPRPILKLSQELLPEHENFGKAWFDKIFSYTWLRTGANQYQSFPDVIAAALEQMLLSSKITMPSGDKTKLLNSWTQLQPWPDVKPALQQLLEKGIRLAFLSNFSESMLRTNARNSGIESSFDYLSTDLAEVFKPHPKAYQLGVDHLGLPKEEIAFCTFAAWDAVGAMWFGYPTVWVNRLNQAMENLQATPTAQGKDLSALLEFVN